MTNRHHTPDGETTPTPQGERPDEPSAIPKDYVPDPYPGWRWSATTGEAKVINSLAEEEAARAEGYTERVPPTIGGGPELPTAGHPDGGVGEGRNPSAPPTPNQDLPPYRRPRLHDGD